jgi:hypothetical protein
MNLYEQFKTDGNVEKTGVLLEYGNNSQGLPICIRIARAGGSNERFAKRLEAVVKPYRRQIQTETIATEQVTKLMRKVYAETVVLGWENVELMDKNPDGSPAGTFSPREFSVEACLELFEDLPDLYQDIVEQAQRAALFRAEIREADAGN